MVDGRWQEVYGRWYEVWSLAAWESVAYLSLLQFLDLLNKLISVPVALGQLILHGQQLTLRDTFGMKSEKGKGKYRVGGRHVQGIT
jgi:hypothetical protein